MSSVCWPERPGAAGKARAYGSRSSRGPSSRASARTHPVLVFLRPRLRTGEGVSPMNSFWEVLGLANSASWTGLLSYASLRPKRHVLNTPVQDLIDRQSGFAVGDLLCGFFFQRPKPRQFRRFYRSSRFARHKITVTVHRSLAKAKGTMVVNPLSLDRILTSVVTIRLDIWFYGKIPHAVHSSNPAC